MVSPELPRTAFKEDWSACRQEFQIAVAVLNDRFTDAANMMKTIGRSGKPAEHEYKTWPLFKEFRLSDEFKKAYKQVFKKAYMVEETAERPKKKSEHTPRVDGGSVCDSTTATEV